MKPKLAFDKTRADGRRLMQQVLLVEGHALFREGLALLLKWEVRLDSVQAGTLAEAHRALLGVHDQICLAIVDVDMPDGDSTKLIEKLHEAKNGVPGVPVLALSDRWSVQRRVRARGAGAEELFDIRGPVKEIIGAAKLMEER